ncbi:MAG TPA: dTMP kinase [Candidatus Marinimicrobia bacterium]|jgi:dTMP kinase|nr:dTMP kinase [Candidatus Neomarinimicrobiota bacterium]MDP7122423.1 dTMP kinase [Candidatus Neomarinimicrobiota bacterium]MDP7529051.1 dTMP kinase [Candidatus Neomarinimicrobiota bacterium]MDP7653915.1 dTMP kinase [Candidatus Neomarinimicrobiota bacterium]HJM86376.1 dTMP kinase [Candidatus Neomarinimicrobiota bacterium]|tara:strand:+ start:1371 stop:1991 length:621 start_codon:yes stop_codon:yes gene_type:complete
MSRGLFITFEGIDGCGKSTQARGLERRLEEEGNAPLLLREPGGTPISEDIRKVLLNPDNSSMAPENEALLLAASRSQLLKEVIIPRLEKGTIVLCDRYIDSTLAYQGFGRDLPQKWLRQINRLAFELAIPDKTFLFDLPVDVALSRLGNRQRDRIEATGVDFLEKVRNGFLTLAEQESDRYIILDGQNQSEELEKDISSQVLRIIS